MVRYKTLEFMNAPGYRVGDDGSVWSRIVTKGRLVGKGVRAVLGSKWKILKATQRSKKIGLPYLCVCIRTGERRKVYAVHTLVLITFVGPCPKGMQCCHEDGNGTNNRLENLRWDTAKGNAQDNHKTGVTKKGESHGMAVLTKSQVEEIKRMHIPRHHEYGVRGLAKRYKMSPSQICRIVNGQSWQ